MKIIAKLALPLLALSLVGVLFLPRTVEAYNLIGGDLDLGQRDFRVFNNFLDSSANDNTTPDPNWPGYDGAELAIWKACSEWGSRLHGNGTGDPHQPSGLGSGGANYDVSFQGNATAIGSIGQNIHSALDANGGGTYAYAEWQVPMGNGWRIRYFENYNWKDGPGTGGSGADLQGIATHEYGHALGLDHTGVSGATMRASVSQSGSVGIRSIAADDIAGVQAIYGSASPTKPVISNVVVQTGGITITGNNFSSSNNEVWFTQAGSGGNGVPVKVTGVSSDGTTIVVSAPGNAGPGDVLVKNNGNGHANLSNAWPIDPSGATCADPSNFCGTAVPNSSGFPAAIGYFGTASIASNNLWLTGVNIPPLSSVVPIASPDQAFTPLGDGTLCLGNTTLGFVLRLGATSSDLFGAINWSIDVNSIPAPVNQFVEGETWNFQLWFRDLGGSSGFNFSNGLTVTWCP